MGDLLTGSQSGGGRGPVRMRIGVDLGGTKIEAIALGPDGGVRLRRRVPTPRDDYAGTVAAIADLVEGIERELGSRATVGIATPGAVSPATGLMKNANSVWLNGRPLAADLERRLGPPSGSPTTRTASPSPRRRTGRRRERGSSSA